MCQVRNLLLKHLLSYYVNLRKKGYTNSHGSKSNQSLKVIRLFFFFFFLRVASRAALYFRVKILTCETFGQHGHSPAAGAVPLQASARSPSGCSTPKKRQIYHTLVTEQTQIDQWFLKRRWGLSHACFHAISVRNCIGLFLSWIA